MPAYRAIQLISHAALRGHVARGDSVSARTAALPAAVRDLSPFNAHSSST